MFYYIEELEDEYEINEYNSTIGGIIIKNSEEEKFHVRWDLLINEEYETSTNLANASWEETEIINQDEEETLVLIKHKEKETFREPEGWGNYYFYKEEWRIKIRHSPEEFRKIKRNYNFRQLMSEIDNLEQILKFENKW